MLSPFKWSPVHSPTVSHLHLLSVPISSPLSLYPPSLSQSLATSELLRNHFLVSFHLLLLQSFTFRPLKFSKGFVFHTGNNQFLMLYLSFSFIFSVSKQSCVFTVRSFLFFFFFLAHKSCYASLPQIFLWKSFKIFLKKKSKLYRDSHAVVVCPDICISIQVYRIFYWIEKIEKL